MSRKFLQAKIITPYMDKFFVSRSVLCNNVLAGREIALPLSCSIVNSQVLKTASNTRVNFVLYREGELKTF